MQTQITIINKLGLHARAAAKMSSLAARFDCRIQVDKDGRQVDAKSVMSLMLLAAAQGTELLLITDGPEQEAAMDAITALINDRFGEGE